MVHPMQYEFERAYHQCHQASAARRRLIDEAERTSRDASTARRSPFEVAVGVCRGVASSCLPLPWRVRLSDRRVRQHFGFW
jgi:hypothetical protein